MNLDQIIEYLTSIADSSRLINMEKYGINTTNALGISVTELRNFSRKIGKNHELALALWKNGIHEARILATLIEIPQKVTEEQMDKWVLDFKSWDLCDQCCNNLFGKTEFAQKKIKEWSGRDEEFVKRAAFCLIAVSAVHDKNVSNKTFEDFFPMIFRESIDQRVYVKKAVNWALRSIGKRNLILNQKAIEAAKEILKKNNKNSLWIANDAIRELSSKKIKDRLEKKHNKDKRL
jgi:3-methyladenine DNA glycosylase AlkD